MKNRDLNEKSIVAVVTCETYDSDDVYRAMKAGINALGGIGKFVDINEKILVKPNFLAAAPVEKAATTNPAVIEAMFRVLKEEKYKNVSYGDSPGHGTSESVAKKGNIHLIAERYGITPADMETSVKTIFHEGITAKEFEFSKGVVEADAVISLCKMKTHALERITGGVKNVYGFIAGLNKAKGHVSYPNANAFARMLSDIHRCVDVRLSIMDGIVAMEGNGPASGDPVSMNVMLFSDDPVAMDTVYCDLINLDPSLVPTNVQGHAMGIGNIEEDKIEIRLVDGGGENYQVVSFKALQEKLGNISFDVDREGVRKSLLTEAAKLFTKLGKRPIINKSLCIKCGICVDHCPVEGKAIDFKNGREKPPVYNYRKCIRCYCCQEMCPQHAIEVKK